MIFLKIKTLPLWGFGLFLLLGAAVPALAADPIVIKFSHVVTSDTPKGKGADYFKKLAEERTQGRVRVEVHPNGQLYKDKEEIEALQLGMVQMLAPALSKIVSLGGAEFEAFDLPYIFPSKEVLHAVTDGPVGARLLKKLEPKGVIGLAFWDNGFKIMSANTPIASPRDMQGMLVRIQLSRVLEAQMLALGALPQVMVLSKVRESMIKGGLDGTENPPSNMYTQKIHEVQKHATITNHGYLGYAVIVNKGFWEGLPPDIRTILDGAMTEATAHANRIAQKENDDALAAMRKAGTTRFRELSREEIEEWRQALLPVHKEMAPRVGPEIIDAINKEAERLKAGSR